MTIEELLPTVPNNYVCCFFGEGCPSADSCLHALVSPVMQSRGRDVVQSVASWVASQKSDGRCPSYARVCIVRIAYGMRHTFDDVPSGKRSQVAARMVARLGKSNYYKKRCGVRPISEAEQAYVAETLKVFGIDAPPKFDRYEERIAWTK